MYEGIAFLTKGNLQQSRCPSKVMLKIAQIDSFYKSEFGESIANLFSILVLYEKEDSIRLKETSQCITFSRFPHCNPLCVLF